MSLAFPLLTADEAASLINNGETIGFSGFTAAGTPKAIPVALGKRAEAEHRRGRSFELGILAGASTGPSVDGALAGAHAVRFRAPFQADKVMRAQINSGEVRFVEMHVSMFPQALRYGFLGPVDWAIVEASDVANGGGLVLSTAVGATPTLVEQARHVLIELNRTQPRSLLGLHDLFEPEDPPTRRMLPIYNVQDRVGAPILTIPRSKIIGIVETDADDEVVDFSSRTSVTDRIGHNIARFLVNELKIGRIPPQFLPLQSGLGDFGNSVLASLAENRELPNFSMYTEVLQDSALDLLEMGRCEYVSASALTLSSRAMRRFFANIEELRSRVVLRPQEISNHPELIRRLGVISINTAMEVDLVGNVNSTHVAGRELMNGIGGSGDFTRNAYLSIFCCPSTRLAGRISTVVPVVTHVDHNEHSVQVIATEYGIADLRGLDPEQRAETVIANCAHPQYRDYLTEFCRLHGSRRAPFSLTAPFAMHEAFVTDGDMRCVRWNSGASKPLTVAATV